MHTHDELIAALLAVQDRHPQWRFGQVVANVAAWAGVDRPGNIWDVSDEAMLRAAVEHLHAGHDLASTTEAAGASKG